MLGASTQKLSVYVAPQPVNHDWYLDRTGIEP
jgi:hypothetical protein